MLFGDHFSKFKKWHRDVLGGPVVKTSPSNAGGVGSIPGRGTKIPRASWPKNQNIKQKKYCNKFNKDLKKNGPHQKKKTQHILRQKQCTAYCWPACGRGRCSCELLGWTGAQPAIYIKGFKMHVLFNPNILVTGNIL